MLESHQLGKNSIYKVEIVVGARGAWTTLMAILDTGTDPILTKDKFVMAEWAP